MKPMNFPGRKLQRQKDALVRFTKAAASPRKRMAITNPRNAEARAEELATLVALARMPDAQARSTRTKKDRTSRAKIGRSP